MANKRNFKKYVTALGSAVCEDMLIARYNVEGIDAKAVDEAVNEVLTAVENGVANANIFFDRGAKAFESREEYLKAKRAFFKALFARISGDVSKSIDGAIKKFNAAVPAAVKAGNKANA